MLISKFIGGIFGEKSRIDYGKSIAVDKTIRPKPMNKETSQNVREIEIEWNRMKYHVDIRER